MRRALTAAAAVAVLTAGGIGTWAIAAGANDGGRTFTLQLHQTAFHVVDQNPTGDSAGDSGVLAGDISRDGKPAGKYQGYCVQIDATGHSECSFTLALPAGQLAIASGYGPGVNGDDVVQDAIIGGTGAYSKARGYADGRETSDDTIVETVHLEG
jgi:hypothetical protein